MSDTASKKLRVVSEPSSLQKLAASACRRRECIRQEIGTPDPLSAPSRGKEPSELPDIVSLLSNPTYDTRFPFPFVGKTRQGRFNIDEESEEKFWSYMGREKFAELVTLFNEVRRSTAYSALYVYGTRGYGKSHLLAALVCLLAAGKDRVVYIPDCRECFPNPVLYMKHAMLFAWADDESKQQDIIAMNTEKEIYEFFEGREDVVFVIDQLNALDTHKDKSRADQKDHLSRWLEYLLLFHKAVLSSSANNHAILNEMPRQTTKKMMYVYGGLTKVSLRNNNSFVNISDYDLGGNGNLVVVEARGRTRRLHSAAGRRVHRLYPTTLEAEHREGREWREGQDQSENRNFQGHF